MTSMIEQLVGEGVARRDDKRLTPTRRSFPARPRELFDLIGTLGREATLPMLFRSTIRRNIDPRQVCYGILGRWPRPDELPVESDLYDLNDAVRSLIGSREFRDHLHQRILSGFPERRRILMVTIPHTDTELLLQTVAALNVVMPEKFDEARDMVAVLGKALARMPMTPTFLMTAPHIDRFIGERLGRDEGASWTLVEPPYRSLDRLVTMLAEPEDIVLGMVEAKLGRRRDGESEEERLARGEQLLASDRWRNPICRALGSGDAEAARTNCRRTDIEIGDRARYAEWVRSAWDIEPEVLPADRSVSSVMRIDQLSAAGRARLDGLVSEDRRFLAWVQAAPVGTGETFVRGGAL